MRIPLCDLGCGCTVPRKLTVKEWLRASHKKKPTRCVACAGGGGQAPEEAGPDEEWGRRAAVRTAWQAWEKRRKLDSIQGLPFDTKLALCTRVLFDARYDHSGDGDEEIKKRAISGLRWVFKGADAKEKAPERISDKWKEEAPTFRYSNADHDLIHKALELCNCHGLLDQDDQEGTKDTNIIDRLEKEAGQLLAIISPFGMKTLLTDIVGPNASP